MSNVEVLIFLSDSVVLSYERAFARLVVHLRLWTGEGAKLVATGVTRLDDVGTWECDAVVRVRELDQSKCFGFALVSTDVEQTLRFAAERLVFVHPNGREESISAT